MYAFGIVPHSFWLLSAHTFCVTACYTAVFLLGLFGIYSTCTARFGGVADSWNPSMAPAISLFGRIALGFLVLGSIFGFFVSKDHFGAYWRWDPREMGFLCVLIWLAALLGIQRRDASERAAALMCVGGNIVVSLAWFGTGIVTSSPGIHFYGVFIYWWLTVFIGVNLCLLVLGIVPTTAKPITR